MSMPKETPEKGVPIGRIVAVLFMILFAGLIYLGTRSIFGGVVLETPPIVGEWQAEQYPWRLTFNEDQSIVSSTGPSPSDESQAWTSVPGKYSVDYFGTLWINLDNGKAYTAPLKVEMPNRFDLIESETFAVTVFQRKKAENPAK